MGDDEIREGGGLTDIFGAAAISKEARQLVHALFSPFTEELGQTLADFMRFARAKNWIRMFEKSASMLNRAGFQAKPVNLKLLVPILDKSGLEDDEDLQTKWAGLLASAAAGNDVHSAYPTILGQLEGTEARILDYFYYERARSWNHAMTEPKIEKMNEELGISVTQFHRSMQNLIRLGLCIGKPREQQTKEDPIKTIQQNLRKLEKKANSQQESLSVTDVIYGMQDGLHRFADDSKIIKPRTITLTEFGAAFVKACGGP